MDQQVKLTMDQLVRAIRTVRVKIKEIESRHKQELEKYIKVESKLEGLILNELRITRQLSAKTEYGAASRYIRIRYIVRDKSEYRRHVIGTESWDLISWGHVMAEGAKEFYDRNDKTLPPGVDASKIEVLSITSPPKPKTKTATEEGQTVDLDRQPEVETL